MGTTKILSESDSEAEGPIFSERIEMDVNSDSVQCQQSLHFL